MIGNSEEPKTRIIEMLRGLADDNKTEKALQELENLSSGAEITKQIRSICEIDRELNLTMIKNELAVAGQYCGPFLAGSSAIYLLYLNPPEIIVPAILIVAGITLFEYSSKIASESAVKIAGLSGRLMSECKDVLRPFDIVLRPFDIANRM